MLILNNTRVTGRFDRGFRIMKYGQILKKRHYTLEKVSYINPGQSKRRKRLDP